MIKKAILYILILTISINTVFAQGNSANDEDLFTRHTIGVDFGPFLGGLGLLGTLGFASAFITFVDMVSGDESSNFSTGPAGAGGIGINYDYAFNKHIH